MHLHQELQSRHLLRSRDSANKHAPEADAISIHIHGRTVAAKAFLLVEELRRHEEAAAAQEEAQARLQTVHEEEVQQLHIRIAAREKLAADYGLLQHQHALQSDELDGLRASNQRIGDPSPLP